MQGAEGEALLQKAQDGIESEGPFYLDLYYILKNSPIKPKITIPVLDSPEPSEATDGSDCEPTPYCPAFGVTRARGSFQDLLPLGN